MPNAYTPGKKRLINPGGGKTPTPSQSDLSRMLPRQMSTGSTRGTQTIGQGNMKLDGANNRITIGTPDGGSIGLGSIPGTNNEYGFFSTDADGTLAMKIVGGTFYAYDPETDLNTVQMGILPNGKGGIAASNEGYSVDDGF